jgi:hypothetical protein
MAGAPGWMTRTRQKVVRSNVETAGLDDENSTESCEKQSGGSSARRQ